jgi:hypothetical protein
MGEQELPVSPLRRPQFHFIQRTDQIKKKLFRGNDQNDRGPDKKDDEKDDGLPDRSGIHRTSFHPKQMLPPLF